MYPDYVYAPKRKRSATVAAPNVSPLPISLDISPLPRPASPPSHALSFGSMLSPSPASSSKRKRLSSDLFHNGNEQNVEADHSFMARRLGDSTEMERMCSWSGSELSDMVRLSFFKSLEFNTDDVYLALVFTRPTRPRPVPRSLLSHPLHSRPRHRPSSSIPTFSPTTR